MCLHPKYQLQFWSWSQQGSSNNWKGFGDGLREQSKELGRFLSRRNDRLNFTTVVEMTEGVLRKKGSAGRVGE